MRLVNSFHTVSVAPGSKLRDIRVVHQTARQTLNPQLAYNPAAVLAPTTGETVTSQAI